MQERIHGASLQIALGTGFIQEVMFSPGGRIGLPAFRPSMPYEVKRIAKGMLSWRARRALLI